MQVIWLIIGVVVGAAIVGFVARRLLTQRRREHAAQRAQAESALATVAAQRDAAVVTSTAAQEARQALERQLLQDTSALKTELAVRDAELAGERRSTAEKVKTLTEAQDAMVAIARQSAGAAVAEQGKQLLTSLEERLKTTSTTLNAEMQARAKSVQESVRPVSETLVRIEAALQKVDVDRQSTHAQLTEQLRAVNEAQSQLRTETGSLSRALRQPHTRGRWGEMHLRRLVELAGMTPNCDFSEQHNVDADGRILRPDMVVHLPGGKDVVVDAKAPLAPYLDACEATDENQRKVLMQTYARGLRTHVKQLAAKDYAAQFASAPDFTVLYIPGEHFFAAACEADHDLIEFAAKMGVLIASPTTLLVMLRTVAVTWQQERVAVEAQAIASLGRQLYDRLCAYLRHVDDVGRRLRSTVEAHNKSVGSLERMVLPTARRFPELGAVAAERELLQPRSVSIAARQLQAPEGTVPLGRHVAELPPAAAVDDTAAEAA